MNQRACSGSVGCLQISLPRPSQISGADSAVSLTFAHVRDRGPENRSLTYESIASKGFAHIEFASVDEALRAMRQGAPHGFRYRQRLLDMDFAPWSFYIGPSYRVVYISMWPASSGRLGLSQWTYDVPNIVWTTVCTFVHTLEFTFFLS